MAGLVLAPLEAVSGSLDARAFLVFLAALLTVKWLLRPPANLPPGPAGWPLVGSALDPELRDRPCHLAFARMARRHGPVFSLYLGSSLALVLNDARSIHEAVVKKADRFSGRKVPGPVKLAFPIKGSLMFSKGEQWHAIRRFTLGAMRNFGVGKSSIAHRINEEARILCDSFEQQKGAPFDPLTLISSSVSNVICQMAFGNRFEYDNETFVRMQDNLRKRFSLSRTSLVNYIPLLYYTPMYKDLRQLEETRRRDMQAVIYEHLATYDPKHIRDIIDLFFAEVRQSSGGEGSGVGGGGGGGQTRAKFPFEDTDMEILLHELFGGGTDTSANMITWHILMMIKYPEVQQKVHDELDRVVGSGRQPAWSERSSLPYCHAVILELLRHRPTGALAMPHVCSETTELQGYSVPSGALVLLNIYAAHHDPEYWDRPEEFRPERFLSDDGCTVVKPTHNSYMPFGLGRRVCAGEQLARMEIFLIIASLMQRFSFALPPGDPVPDMDGVFHITLAPCPFRVCATPRHS